jgi:hypothetical protein
MMFRPVVLAAAAITKSPTLEPKWGTRARAHQHVAEQIFQKWDARDCWRSVKEGGLWMVPAFGVDRRSPNQSSAGYADRLTTSKDAKYYVWNYWEPGGPWDYDDDNLTGLNSDHNRLPSAVRCYAINRASN